MEFETDLSPSTWIGPRLLPWSAELGTRVASIVPAGYPAYVRVLHPASRSDRGLRKPVTWREVAAWSGRVYHPLAQFDWLSSPVGTPAALAPLDQPPRIGSLPQTLCEALFQALAAWTTTPEVCWLGIWDGWGWGSSAMTTSVGSVAASSVISFGPDADSSDVPEGLRRLAELRSRQAELAERVRRAPRFSRPHRSYLLSRASLGTACDQGGFPFHFTPSLAWPDDRSWCLATEIDFDSTLVAASDACAAALLADDRFEALPVHPEDRLDVYGDLLNHPGGH